MAKLIGTAGHVDHGKTTLIRAMTGIDADRLPEEKSRGMTIDIGFAFVDLPVSGRVSIVDVPGHEKFVTNMLVGALGINVALLCVSADEGVMPQTREHLQILELLPVQTLIVALTRSDLVDDELRELAILDVQEFLQPTRFRGSQIIPVSALSGENLDTLRSALDEALQKSEDAPDGPWYLPIDRVFTVKGHGAVVTGTMARGRVKVGDEAVIMPGNLKARIRSIHSHDESVETAESGRRIALNLSGVKAEDLTRGMQIGRPGAVFETSIFDTQVKIVGEIKHAMRARVSVGAEEGIGKIFLNEHDPNLIQVRLESTIACSLGQSVVVRRYSPPDVLAGGTIIVPQAIPRRRGEHAQQVAQSGDLRTVILEAVGKFPDGVETAEICRLTGRSPQDLGSVFEDLLAVGDLVGFAGLWAIPSQFGEAVTKLTGALETLHAEKPSQGLVPRELALQRAGLKWSGKPLDRILAKLAQDGHLVVQGTGIRLSTFKIKLSDRQTELLSRVIIALDAAGPNVPPPGELANQIQVPVQAIEEILRLGGEAGEILRIDELVYYSVAGFQKLKKDLHERFGDRGFAASEVRDAWSSSRKYVIPVLEHLDATGFTIRVGDQRKIRGSGT